MTDGRTHEASPQRLRRARVHGDVAFSHELVSAAVLLVVACYAWSSGRELVSVIARLARIGLASAAEARGGALQLQLQPVLVALSRALLPVLAAVFCAALLASQLQVGFGLRLRERSKQHPRLLSLDRAADAALATVKGVVLLGVVASVLWDARAGVLSAFERSASELPGIALVVARAMLVRVTVALVLLGAIDFIYQRVRRTRRLRMSRRELQEEHRQSEGDPLVKAERGRRARELYAQATLAELAQATLLLQSRSQARVIALAFDEERDAVPRLWLKGEDELAQRLIERAHALGVPVHDAPELIDALYRLEPSEPVPEAHYAQVASQLAVAKVARASRGPARGTA